MSNSHDEFESLIENFKLNDIEDPAKEGPEPARRGAFNFEEDERRYAAARPRPAQSAEPRQAPPARTAQPTRQQEPPRQPAPAPKKRGFKVNIADEQFYEPATDARAPRGGGGGRGGRGGGDGEEPEHAGGGAGRWLKAIAALVVVLGVSVFLAVFALQSAGDMFGMNKPDQEISFQLPDSLSVSQIASLLKEKGIITQPLTFQLYASLKFDLEDFFPGEYNLNSNMSYDQIATAFRTPPRPDEITLTFIEGESLSEMADKLEKNGVCKKEDLFAYLDEGLEYKVLSGVPDDANRFRRYEGYFFPDTYNFYQPEDVETVVQKFITNFNRRVDEDIREKMEKAGLTMDQAVTLASVIQKEAGHTEDMRMVSSVFRNRLAAPQTFPNLESDVTIFYVENNIKPYLSDPANAEHQPMYDAYNTYKCAGLPVGPISNPGLDAIEAALNPKASDYYFFLADKEGKFYYAKTANEHLANIQAAGIGGVDHGIALPEGATENAAE